MKQLSDGSSRIVNLVSGATMKRSFCCDLMAVPVMSYTPVEGVLLVMCGC
ncbi:MAG TPA: hypothetical protein VKA23_02955 [Mariprofundaceae bacterium]|nr:hypothetical protein [Mariprofundaceae bacterium]